MNSNFWQVWDKSHISSQSESKVLWGSPDRLGSIRLRLQWSMSRRHLCPSKCSKGGRGAQSSSPTAVVLPKRRKGLLFLNHPPRRGEPSGSGTVVVRSSGVREKAVAVRVSDDRRRSRHRRSGSSKAHERHVFVSSTATTLYYQRTAKKRRDFLIQVGRGKAVLAETAQHKSVQKQTLCTQRMGLHSSYRNPHQFARIRTDIVGLFDD